MSKYFNEKKMKIAPLLRQWAKEGLELGAEWMIIMEVPSGEIFPLYAGKNGNPREVFAKYLTVNGTDFNPIECYDFTKNIEAQISTDVNQVWDRERPIQSGNFTNVQKFMGTGPKMDDDN
jgi:hypothetical protein